MAQMVHLGLYVHILVTETLVHGYIIRHSFQQDVAVQLTFENTGISDQIIKI